MKIHLDQVSKRFVNEVVLRKAVLTLEQGSATAVLGPNGSGKSTLLQLIAGALRPTKGVVSHSLNGSRIAEQHVHRHVSIAAPYLNLYTDLSVKQSINVHAKFKPFVLRMSYQQVAERCMLDHVLDRPVLHLSSGMQQRLKLALAILSDTSLLLLDEPASNLDADGVKWYQELLKEHRAQRTLVICSNQHAAEYGLCTTEVDVLGLK